jgi:hypothetical protein
LKRASSHWRNRDRMGFGQKWRNVTKNELFELLEFCDVEIPQKTLENA